MLMKRKLFRSSNNKRKAWIIKWLNSETREGSVQRDRDMVCIDTYRVLDSCRDKDCFEDVRVYITCAGQDIIDRTCVVRAKNANVVWSCIDIDNVPFNRGFYQLFIKIFVKIQFEACLGPGNSQEFEGVAIVEKKVILFGGEGNVNVFKSEIRKRRIPLMLQLLQACKLASDSSA